jgi:hypothetical protein
VGSGDRSHGTLSAITDFRAPTVDYLGQVARSAEQLGYEAVLTPTGTWCEDAWIFTAALSQVTRRLKFLVAFRPGLISPTLAAHQAATFVLMRITPERVRQVQQAFAGTESVGQQRMTALHNGNRSQPHLEEAYYFAEGAAAEFRQRGLLAASAPQ